MTAGTTSGRRRGIEVSDLTDSPGRRCRGPGAQACLSCLGYPIPPLVNRSARFGSVTISRLGKNDFILSGEAGTAMPEGCKPDCGGCFDEFSAQAFCRFRLGGRALPVVLAQILSIDIRDISARPGRVFQTRIAGADGLAIVPMDDPERIDLLVDRSLQKWLQDVLTGLP